MSAAQIHDTFGQVFSPLDPERFQEWVVEWTRGVADFAPGEVAAIYGKTASAPMMDPLASGSRTPQQVRGRFWSASGPLPTT